LEEQVHPRDGGGGQADLLPVRPQRARVGAGVAHLLIVSASMPPEPHGRLVRFG
jgi:hypothetical protein